MPTPGHHLSAALARPEGVAHQRRGTPAVTDTEWAVALVREAASVRFASRTVPHPDGSGDACANPGRHHSVTDDGRESVRT